MFWKNKKDDIPSIIPIINRTNTIYLYFRDGFIKSLWVKWDDSDDYGLPWMGFYDWYFKDTTDAYLMKYDKGQFLVLRSELKRFEVVVVENRI